MKPFRILCISPLFAPKADPEAYCGAKLILELLRRGIGAAVLCMDPSAPRSAACDDSKLWEPLKEITHTIGTPGEKDALYSARMAVRYRTVSYARWTTAVVEKAAALHREKPFDLVYSRSLPMEAHVAGYWTMKRLGIPWLVNINDPWDWHLTTEELRQKFPLYYGMMSTFWMKRTLRTASFIMYPSARLRDYHVAISGVQHQSAVIPHIGYVRETKQEDQSVFRIVHAGRLGGWERRNPDALLKGLRLFLAKLPEARRFFRMIFVGPEDKSTRAKVQKLGMQSVVENTGRVNYERSLEFIRSAAVCVLVEGVVKEGIFLPSKLADYVAAGKPVLALSPGNGVLSDLAKHRGIVRVDADDAEAVSSAINVYYRAFKQKALSRHSPAEALALQFSPEVVTEEFCAKVVGIIEMRKMLPAGPGSSPLPVR